MHMPILRSGPISNVVSVSAGVQAACLKKAYSSGLAKYPHTIIAEGARGPEGALLAIELQLPDNTTEAILSSVALLMIYLLLK